VAASVPVGPALGGLALPVGALPVALPVRRRPDAVDSGRALERRGLAAIERHQRRFALTVVFDRLAQQPTIGADRLVRSAEMLAGAILDRAHRLAGPLVVHVDVGAHASERAVLLLVRVEAVVVV